MSTKADLMRENSLLREQIDLLKKTLSDGDEEKKRLRDQVDRLQEGLMASRAPEAYRDQRLDKLGWDDPYQISPEQMKERNKKADMMNAYLRAIEEPLFGHSVDAESIERTLSLIESSVLKNSNTTPSSIHGNDES